MKVTSQGTFPCGVGVGRRYVHLTGLLPPGEPSEGIPPYGVQGAPPQQQALAVESSGGVPLAEPQPNAVARGSQGNEPEPELLLQHHERRIKICFSYKSQEGEPPPQVRTILWPGRCRWPGGLTGSVGSIQVSAAKEQLEARGHQVKWGLDVSSTAADWRKLWMQW